MICTATVIFTDSEALSNEHGERKGGSSRRLSEVTASFAGQRDTDPDNGCI